VLRLCCQAFVKKSSVLHENSAKVLPDVFSFEICLRPPVIFYNVLPYPVTVTVLVRLAQVWVGHG